jgi:hypothetical protein
MRNVFSFNDNEISYLNLAFVLGSVAVDDDMHFKIVKLEGPPIVTK